MLAHANRVNVVCIGLARNNLVRFGSELRRLRSSHLLLLTKQLYALLHGTTQRLLSLLVCGVDPKRYYHSIINILFVDNQVRLGGGIALADWYVLVVGHLQVHVVGLFQHYLRAWLSEPIRESLGCRKARGGTSAV